MLKRVVLLSFLLAALSLWACAEKINTDVVITRVAREVDLSSHLAQEVVSITLENEGENPVAWFLYTIDPGLAGKLAYIAAEVKDSENEETSQELQVKETTISDKPDLTVYRIDLPRPLATKETVTVDVETVFTHTVLPYPREITQNEKQLVQFSGNAYVFLPYPTKTQSTNVILPQKSSIEAFTKVSPVNTNENEINYGPYSNLPAYSHTKMQLHYENNGPFIGLVFLERIIEVSHWGNVAVEEHFHIRHFGAKLKGSFSRYDYQRIPNSGPSSVKSYTTFLPAAARDVYYRDEIGNISTSALREVEDYVELEIRPRFPLFGGWQTRCYTGYNVPSYEYLYHSGSHYMLKMRFVDHVFDHQVIENIRVKIILPEGARNIVLKAPYPVTEHPREFHQTYLDTVGRPVVIATKDNLVEQHVQDFELYYDYETLLMFQEPLLLVTGLYLFFLLVIAIVRLDFSITKDVVLLAKQQASVTMDTILQAHDRRMALVSSYQESVATYKQNKDVKVYKNMKKTMDDKFRQHTDTITNQGKILQANDPEGHAKVSELQKKSAELKAAVDDSCVLAEQLVTERMGKQKYIEQDKAMQSRITRLQSEIDTIVQTL